jgi:predicted aspartyl protease
MIIGNVNANREIIIQIAVLGDYKNIKSVKAVIDTGYTGDLMLSRAIINAASKQQKRRFIMAERLAVDVSQTYESGFLGKRGDDKFPCTGARITRV